MSVCGCGSLRVRDRRRHRGGTGGDHGPGFFSPGWLVPVAQRSASISLRIPINTCVMRCEASRSWEAASAMRPRCVSSVLFSALFIALLLPFIKEFLAPQLPPSFTIRSVIYGSNLLIYINGNLIGNYTVPASTGSYAGFAWCSMTTDGNGNYNNAGGWEVGHHDTIAPNPIGGNIPRTAYSSNISFKWTPTTDDANGSGVWRYEVYRDGGLIGYWWPSVWPGVPPLFEYTDFSVAAGSTHTYACL